MLLPAAVGALVRAGFDWQSPRHTKEFIMLVRHLIVACSFLFLAQATAARAETAPGQANGIHHFDFTGNKIGAEGRNVDENGREDFPYATRCSCYLTDSCSVSCDWDQHASCRAYRGDAGGLYCSCYCD